MFVPEASDSARKVTESFYYILGIEVVLLALVTAAMVFFVLRYRRQRHPHPENVEGGTAIEITWTVIPTLLVIVMFVIGWQSFSGIRKVPEGAMVVRVKAQQWSWQFTYDNGRQADLLRVPLGKPVKLVMHSQDVLHCLYVPAFRIKEDCVPGMETYLWFTADRPGSYDIFCTEYCGLGHSGMISKVMVMQAAEFESWYRQADTGKGGEGIRLLETKGCLGCHSIDGSKKIGPTFKGLYGHEVEVLTNGRKREIIADEEYLRRSVLEPAADIAEGYPNIMPKLPVTEEELKAITGYLKELK
jgi:cytochrome c oxidase subunit 2